MSDAPGGGGYLPYRWMMSGRFTPAACDLDQHLAGSRHRVGPLGQPQDFGRAELRQRSIVTRMSTDLTRVLISVPTAAAARTAAPRTRCQRRAGVASRPACFST